MVNPKSEMRVVKMRRSKILKRAPFGEIRSELERTANAFDAVSTVMAAMPKVFNADAMKELTLQICEVNEDVRSTIKKLDGLTAGMRKIYGHEIKPILVQFDAKEFGGVDYVEDDAIFINLVNRALEIGDTVGMARLTIIMARLRSDLSSRRSKLAKLSFRVSHEGKSDENDSAAMMEEKMKVVCEMIEKRIKFCNDKFLELHNAQKMRLDSLMAKFKAALTQF